MLQWDPRKVKKCVYFRNGCENRNSKTTLWSKTFDFVYWGTFLTPNSEVFAQENFLNFWKSLIFQKKMLLKKFSLMSLFRRHFSDVTSPTSLPRRHFQGGTTYFTISDYAFTPDFSVTFQELETAVCLSWTTWLVAEKVERTIWHKPVGFVGAAVLAKPHNQPKTDTKWLNALNIFFCENNNKTAAVSAQPAKIWKSDTGRPWYVIQSTYN